VTSFAWVLPLFVAARFFAGLTPMANDVVQPGLLGDLYDDKDQPRVFAVWRGAATISGVSALLLGAVAAVWDWRAAFLVVALLGVIVLVPAWRVPEPSPGGRPEDVLEASLEAEAGVLPDVDADKAVALTRTRWLWVAAFLYGAASVPLTTLLSLFFDDVYGLGPFGRGVLVAISTAGTLVGLAVGAPLAERDDRQHGTAGLITAMTRSLLLLSVSVVLIGIAPVLLLSVFGVVLTSISIGLLMVSFYPLINRSSTPGQRSRMFAKITFVVGLGAIAAIPVFAIGDSFGYRVTTAVVAAIVGTNVLACVLLRRDHVRHTASLPPVRLGAGRGPA
jgi:MFS family permease